MNWCKIDDGAKTGTPVLLYRPPAETGQWDQIVIARWVDKVFDDEHLQAWCWFDGVGNIFDDIEFEEAVANGRVYESARDFTYYVPLSHPDEPPVGARGEAA